jgi:hypothetical protein
LDVDPGSAGRKTAGPVKSRKGRLSRRAAICAVVAVAVLGSARTAAAGTPLQIGVNGKPMSSSGPQITATLFYRGTDQWLLTVINSSSNPDGENITEVDGAVSQAARQQGISINRVAAQEADAGDAIVAAPQNGISLMFTNAPVNGCFMPNNPQTSFTCPTMYGGFGSGSTEEYVLTSNDTNEKMPLLGSINIKMTLGACTGDHQTKRSTANAADDCAQPGVTKIANAKINRTTGAASFTYQAKFATKYVCELLYRHRIEHRTSCASAKTYARLDPGTYFFLVWGANKAGVAKKATVYGFKIG